MITKADLEARIAELRTEAPIQMAKLEASYAATIGELERLLSSFDSDNKKE